MNSKTFFPLVAVLAILAVSFASALTDLETSGTVTFNDVQVSPSSIVSAGTVGDTIPVRVVFTANENASDVKVKITMEGFRNDITAETGRFNLVSGSTYSRLLTLNLPSDLSDGTTKDFKVYVDVVSADEKDEVSFPVEMQRNAYSFNPISVDFDQQVSAGQVVPISVVVENNGMETLDNGFITASIDSLGVSAKTFLGDLTPQDCNSDNCNQNNADSIQRTLNLKIPDNAAAGVYDLTVQMYNADSTVTSTKKIQISESATTSVLAAVKNQDIAAGETKTYDLIIVNSGNTVKVYNIQTVSGSALSVSAPAVVTVGPQSSATVPISVTASKTTAVGSYTFSVSVDGQQTVLGANVVSASTNVSTSVVALTVVLVIIFVVLLVVLIVLLSRRESKPSEEVETSYY